MARYRKIDPRIWKDEGFRQFTLEEKAIAVYVFTAQSNRIGLFNFSPAMAAEDLETFPETFLKGFEKVCRVLRWTFDKPSRVLYIPTWFKYNCPENPNVLTHCLQDLHDLPSTPLLAAFERNLQYLPATFHTTFRKGWRKPSANQEQEQEQKQEQKQKQETAAPTRARDNRRVNGRARAATPPPPAELNEPGELDEDLQRAIQAMECRGFHRLAHPSAETEAFWNTQLEKVEREGLTIFACLADVDGYIAGRRELWPVNMDQAQERMRNGIDTAITKLLRRQRKVQHG